MLHFVVSFWSCCHLIDHTEHSYSMVNIISSINISCSCAHQFFFLPLEILRQHSKGQNDGILCFIDFQISSNSILPFAMTLIVFFMCRIIIFHLWLLFHFDIVGFTVHGLLCCCCLIFFLASDHFSLPSMRFLFITLANVHCLLLIAYCYYCWIFWNIYCVQRYARFIMVI